MIGIGGAGLVVTGVVKPIIHDSPRTRTAWDLGATRNGLVVFGTF